MNEKEARIHIDYTDGRRSSPEPSIIKRRAPAITLEHCCICNHADAPSMMAHVGDGVYKCRKWFSATLFLVNFCVEKSHEGIVPNIHYSSASGKGLMLISAFASPLQ